MKPTHYVKSFQQYRYLISNKVLWWWQRLIAYLRTIIYQCGNCFACALHCPLTKTFQLQLMFCKVCFDGPMRRGTGGDAFIHITVNLRPKERRVLLSHCLCVGDWWQLYNRCHDRCYRYCNLDYHTRQSTSHSRRLRCRPIDLSTLTPTCMNIKKGAISPA